jgi:hypothetical protein
MQLILNTNENRPKLDHKIGFEITPIYKSFHKLKIAKLRSPTIEIN